MSKSHLVNKDFGSITINSEQLSASIGQLYIDNNLVGGGNGNIYNSVGTLYNLTPTYGSLQVTNQLACFIDTTGNTLTNTGLLITNNNFNTFEALNGLTIGNTTGTLISNLSGNSGLYLGDDNVSIFNNMSNGTNSNILIDANVIYFCNAFSSLYYNTFISQGSYLSTPDLNVTNSCTLANTCFGGNIWHSGAITNYQQTGGNTSTITTNSEQMATLTTTNLTLSTFGSLIFTVNNNSSNNNPITLSITGYTGTTGNPYAYIQNVGTTSFNIVINNNNNLQPLNGALTLIYNILFQT